MIYDKDEYLKMVIGLNVNRNRKVFIIASSAFFLFCIVIGIILKHDFCFNIVLAIGLSLAFYFYLRNTILSSAKKANFVADIISVEQIIFEDKIVEKVKKKDNVENVGEYYYSDIAFVKEDKFNLYLYLNPNAAVIVSKSKLDNLDDFMKLLEKKRVK